MPDVQKNTYLIISLGSIGIRHLENLQQLDSQAKIIVLRRQKSNKGIEHENVIEVSSIEDALNFKPTIAIIASPAVFHVEQALILLENNIHLFIEKPLSHNLNDLEKLQRTAKEKSLIVMVGYVLRFSPALKKVKSLLKDNVVGNIVNVSAHCGQYLPNWRVSVDYRKTVSAKKELGGGVLLELSHEFDYLRWLFGEAESVIANSTNTKVLEIDVEDKVDVLMDFDQGFSGYIHLNFLEKKVHRVLRINGLDGSISCDLVHGKININTVSGNREIDLSEEKNDMYLEELTSFLECIETQKTPVVTLDDGVRVIEIVEAVKQSSANRQRIGV